MNQFTRRRLLQATGALGVGWSFAGPTWAASDDPSYAWEWPIPWLPESDDDIVVVQVPPTGIVIDDVGSADKLLLLVAPEEPIAGPIRARFLRYRGVVMIGATIRQVGNVGYDTPVGTILYGRHTFQISWDRKDQWEGNAPFLFLANIDFSAAESRWGDFLRTGTSRNPANTNFSQWCNVYLQKIRVDVGHYGWTPSGGSQEPHSDFFQFPFGGLGSLHVYDCDIAWSYQTFFTRVLDPNPPHPTAVHRFKRVYTRCMPDPTDIYISPAGRTQFHINALGTQAEMDRGQYQAHAIWNWHAGLDPEGNSSLTKLFSLGGQRPIQIGNRLTYRHVIPPNRALPLISGYFNLSPPTETFAPPEQIGWAKRVADIATLRAMVAVED
ncbi:MAG: hypothetical protein U1E14_10910 [Geminicoccaceae bacterium]